MTAAGAPLLESKLHPPRPRRGVVRRARLAERLDRGHLPPVTLLAAPAGFGKTTLLAEWIAAAPGAGPHPAWVSLDPGDGDPSVFWAHVIAALDRAAPGVGAEAGAGLLTAPREPERAVAPLVNALAGLAEDVVLVLDDYHAVASPEVHAAMRFLVAHMPAQLRLVVATRADPPWPLAALRARGDLLEIRAGDLRFTAAEADAYLTGAMGLALAPAQIGALEARTEGWIAALQLAALSLRDRDDPGAFIAGFAGDDRFVVDYLVDEVLDRQPEDIRAFLLETAILGRMTAPLCATVTGRDDAGAVLASLERSNLFLVPLDDRRRWYRYHHLFSDVLRARLAEERPHHPPELHRRAGDWFAAEGDLPEAVRHALAAGDVDRAADRIERAIPALRMARQETTLRAWLEAMPAASLADRPVLAVGLVGARMAEGDTGGVEALLDAVERRLDGGVAGDGVLVRDAAEFARLPVQVAMYRAGVALLHGDPAGTAAHAERAAALAGPDDHLGRGAAAALVGLARWTDGDLRAAEEHYAAAVAALVDAGHLADVLGCSLGLADIRVAQGRLDAAERALTAGLEIATAHAPLRGTADMHTGLAEIALERDALDEAAAHLRRGHEAGEHLALAQDAHRRRVVEARLRAAAGDHRAALALLAEAERRYDTDYSPRTRPPAATAARVSVAAGDLAAAGRWARECRLTADDDPAYVREYEHLTLARVLLATGRAAEALRLLERLLAAADAGGRAGSAVEAQALVALAHHERGNGADALAALAGALARAAGERMVRVFLDAGPAMAGLLRTAARRGPAADLAVAVIGRTARPAAGVAPPPGGTLTARERDVLRLLRSDLTGPEIAAELVVSLNTVRTHTKNIFAKLGVTNRRAAVRRAADLGL